MELTKHAVMIRGAITVGKVRFNEHQVFGPGIVRAYHLESQMAQFPRIVVDPTALTAVETDERLRKDTHSPEEERAYIRKMLRRDTDGLWFVDYLRAGYAEANDDEAFERMLEWHRDAVTAQIQTHPKFDRTGQKLAWIAQYHNRVIREFKKNGLPEDRAEELTIEIPNGLVPVL